MRLSKALNSLTSGNISSGSPSVRTGDKSCGRRDATSARTRCTGINEERTTHHTASAKSGASNAMGKRLCHADSRANARRTRMSCAT